MLRAAIPVGDHARGIEHEDRVVLDALHEDTKSLLALAQLGLRHLALGQVARHLGIADDFAPIVSDRVDQHVHPDSRAVLAHAPALVLEAPGRGGGRQGAARQPRRLILVGVKDGEMLADDLIGGIALEATRAGVPRGDDAIGVQHEHGIIRDRLDEEPEALFFHQLRQALRSAPRSAACCPCSLHDVPTRRHAPLRMQL